jgi:hypothetical protein
VDDVPLTRLGAKLRLELFVRVDLRGVAAFFVVAGRVRSVVRRDIRLFLCLFFGLESRFVIGRRNRGVGLVERVDVESVVDDGVGLRIHRGVERFEQAGKVAVLLVGVADDVDRFVLGRCFGVLRVLSGVAFLYFIHFGRLLCGRGDLKVVAVFLRH